MKLFKDSLGIYHHIDEYGVDTTVQAGTMAIQKIGVTSFAIRQNGDNLNPFLQKEVFRGEANTLVDDKGVAYANYEDILNRLPNFFVKASGGGGGTVSGVESVNDRTGKVVLTNYDVSLGLVKNVDQTNPSNIIQDSNHTFLTDSAQNINGVKTFTSLPKVTIASDPINYELTSANYVNRLDKNTNDKLVIVGTKVTNLETKAGEQQISITNLTASKANKLPSNTPVSILESSTEGDLKASGKVFNNDGNSSNDIWTADKLINYINSKVVGLWEWRGGFDLSAGILPTDKVEKGDVWLITKEGTVQGKLIKVNSLLIANEDNPLQDLTKWSIRQPDLDYVAENVINKEKLALDDSEDKYPCNKVVKKAIKDITLTKDNFATINGVSVMNDGSPYPTSFNLEPKINKAQFDESYFDGTKVWKQFKDVDIIKKYRTLESVGMNQVGKTYLTSEFIQLLMNKTVNEPSIKESFMSVRGVVYSGDDTKPINIGNLPVNNSRYAFSADIWSQDQYSYSVHATIQLDGSNRVFICQTTNNSPTDNSWVEVTSNSSVGDVSKLYTNNKSSVVNAINEIVTTTKEHVIVNVVGDLLFPDGYNVTVFDYSINKAIHSLQVASTPLTLNIYLTDGKKYGVQLVHGSTPITDEIIFTSVGDAIRELELNTNKTSKTISGKDYPFATRDDINKTQHHLTCNFIDAPAPNSGYKYKLLVDGIFVKEQVITEANEPLDYYISYGKSFAIQLIKNDVIVLQSKSMTAIGTSNEIRFDEGATEFSGDTDLGTYAKITDVGQMNELQQNDKSNIIVAMNSMLTAFHLVTIRAKKTIVIPAGKSLVMVVYTDNIGKSFEITEFTDDGEFYVGKCNIPCGQDFNVYLRFSGDYARFGEESTMKFSQADSYRNIDFDDKGKIITDSSAWDNAFGIADAKELGDIKTLNTLDKSCTVAAINEVNSFNQKMTINLTGTIIPTSKYAVRIYDTVKKNYWQGDLTIEKPYVCYVPANVGISARLIIDNVETAVISTVKMSANYNERTITFDANPANPIVSDIELVSGGMYATKEDVGDKNAISRSNHKSTIVEALNDINLFGEIIIGLTKLPADYKTKRYSFTLYDQDMAVIDSHDLEQVEKPKLNHSFFLEPEYIYKCGIRKDDAQWALEDKFHQLPSKGYGNVNFDENGNFASDNCQESDVLTLNSPRAVKNYDLNELYTQMPTEPVIFETTADFINELYGNVSSTPKYLQNASFTSTAYNSEGRLQIKDLPSITPDMKAFARGIKVSFFTIEGEYYANISLVDALNNTWSYLWYAAEPNGAVWKSTSGDNVAGNFNQDFVLLSKTNNIQIHSSTGTTFEYDVNKIPAEELKLGLMPREYRQPVTPDTDIVFNKVFGFEFEKIDAGTIFRMAIISDSGVLFESHTSDEWANGKGFVLTTTEVVLPNPITIVKNSTITIIYQFNVAPKGKGLIDEQERLTKLNFKIGSDGIVKDTLLTEKRIATLPLDKVVLNSNAGQIRAAYKTSFDPNTPYDYNKILSMEVGPNNNPTLVIGSGIIETIFNSQPNCYYLDEGAEDTYNTEEKPIEGLIHKLKVNMARLSLFREIQLTLTEPTAVNITIDGVSLYTDEEFKNAPKLKPNDSTVDISGIFTVAYEGDLEIGITLRDGAFLVGEDIDRPFAIVRYNAVIYTTLATHTEVDAALRQKQNLIVLPKDATKFYNGLGQFTTPVAAVPPITNDMFATKPSISIIGTKTVNTKPADLTPTEVVAMLPSATTTTNGIMTKEFAIALGNLVTQSSNQYITSAATGGFYNMTNKIIDGWSRTPTPFDVPANSIASITLPIIKDLQEFPWNVQVQLQNAPVGWENLVCIVASTSISDITIRVFNKGTSPVTGLNLHARYIGKMK